MNGITEKLIRLAPQLNEKESREANALFSSYIFRRRRTREIWTTCCGVHGELPEGHYILEADHTPEPKHEHRYGCHMGVWGYPAEVKKPRPEACPFCGRISPVKELGRTGNRKNLWSYHRVVVLRWWRGSLWAIGLELKKAYTAEWQLTALPEAKALAVYRFSPGKVEYCQRYWWCDMWKDGWTIRTTCMKPDFKVYEPFGYCSEYGTGYEVIGLDEVDKSPFRWCGVKEYMKTGCELIRFLAVCTAYPRQVEMLIKAGLTEAVKDFAERKKSNAAAFNWYAEDPFQGLGLTKQEIRAFMAGSRDLNVLARYKQCCRKKLPVTLEGLNSLRREIMGEAMFNRVVAKMKQYRLGTERITNYFEKVRAEEQAGKKKGYTTLSTIAGWWCDYIDAAEFLGYDMKNDVFLLPKGLKVHHDKATKAMTAIKAERAAEQAREFARNRQKQLTMRYTYTDGRWLIRAPVDAADIIAEGKNLKHCVGGYADRHMEGKRTILFLRDRTRPHKSLVTIEMDGNRIVQIHGWDDERSACMDNPKRESPREIYREFLDGWLDWLKAGSKRDKRGMPIVPKTKKKRGNVA